uniref:Uncharacterized protein n=1 Tax=Trypanosoma vivax (strain Y486) TaxID=1055687 RepID=G0U2G1_TRYVY|nr:conserved hypothetical protein [Trypanosoma vivax Y486]
MVGGPSCEKDAAAEGRGSGVKRGRRKRTNRRGPQSAKNDRAVKAVAAPPLAQAGPKPPSPAPSKTTEARHRGRRRGVLNSMPTGEVFTSGVEGHHRDPDNMLQRSSAGAVASVGQALATATVASEVSTRENGERALTQAPVKQQGLSVYAAPFQPRCSVGAPGLSAGPECSRMGTPNPSASDLLWTCGGGCRARRQHASALQLSSVEFPRTPLAKGGGNCQPRSPQLNVTLEVPVSPVGSLKAGGCVDTSLACLTPLASRSPVASSIRRKCSVLQPGACRDYGSGEPAQLLEAQESRETSRIRHRLVPFTDAEALDEARMFDMLKDSGSDGEDGGHSELADHLAGQHSPCWLDAASGSSDVHRCAGGYWAAEGPSVATQRFLRRGTPSTASLNLNPAGGRLSACVSASDLYASQSVIAYGENDENLWEMSSSAYAESLDDAQLEWIEQQLRAKEPP